MAFAFLFAMGIAQTLQLQYAPSAGIVALLTIQNTRKETFLIGIRRFFSFFIALFYSCFIFQVLGYHVTSFAVFLIVFVGTSFSFHLEDGIAMNAVIITHFLIEESMSQEWIYNEFQIFLIGMIVGILMNLYMPSQRKKIQIALVQMDESMKDLIIQIADCLVLKCQYQSVDERFDEFKRKLKFMLVETSQQMDNQLLQDTQYEFQYILMRRQQLTVLQDIYDLLKRINWYGEQAQLISQYLYMIATVFHKDNDVQQLYDWLDKLDTYFDKDALPQSRLEFENRALLFTILMYIRKFLDLKYEFQHYI